MSAPPEKSKFKFSLERSFLIKEMLLLFHVMFPNNFFSDRIFLSQKKNNSKHHLAPITKNNKTC